MYIFFNLFKYSLYILISYNYMDYISPSLSLYIYIYLFIYPLYNFIIKKRTLLRCACRKSCEGDAKTRRLDETVKRHGAAAADGSDSSATSSSTSPRQSQRASQSRVSSTCTVSSHRLVIEICINK